VEYGKEESSTAAADDERRLKANVNRIVVWQWLDRFFG
jgi:hypothetical protein